MITDMTGESGTIGTGVSPALDENTHEAAPQFSTPHSSFINSLEQFEALSAGWDLAMFSEGTFDFGIGDEDGLRIDEKLNTLI